MWRKRTHIMQETNKILYGFVSSSSHLKSPQAHVKTLAKPNQRVITSKSRSMSSREQKKAALYEKLMLLRDVTNSSSKNKTSIILDASKYIEELKQKVETLNQEIGTSEASTDENSLPVAVETLEKGFLVKAYSEKNCSGLLVSILEAFEELGLDVLDARVSCSDSFHLEAVGGDHTQGHVEGIDAQVVKEAVLQAIKNEQKSEQ